MALRKDKLNYVFDTFFDINQDGSIEKSDFELAIENIAKIRGYKAGDAKYNETSASFLDIWEKLRVHADANKDNKVSRDEWYALWSEPLNEDWKKMYMNFMFKLQDTSGDGTIDWDEFSCVCTSFAIPADQAKKAFDTISKNGSANIDIKYYEGLWTDYFCSEDPKAIGNCIFGKTF